MSRETMYSQSEISDAKMRTTALDEFSANPLATKSSIPFPNGFVMTLEWVNGKVKIAMLDKDGVTV